MDAMAKARQRTKSGRRGDRPRQPALAAPPPTPDYIRLPREGVLCPFSQLTRGKLRELIESRKGRPKPPVESFVLPNLGGSQKGVRLIVLSSLLAYLERCRASARENSEQTAA